MAGGDDAIKRAWMADALGVVIPERTAPAVGASGQPATIAPADPGSAISQAALKPEVWSQKIGSALSSPPGAKPSAPITSPVPLGPKTKCVGKNGRKVDVAVGPDGRVAMTRDQPPIREVTFSGGGGKGAALPGAVAALEQSGVLKDVREFRGASVGSITAAMLAAGVNADQFAEVGDQLGSIVKSEKIVPVKMTGDGLEDFVRDSMSKSVQGKIQKYLDKAHDAEPDGDEPPVDPNTVKMLHEMQVRLAKGGGVTFGDLRALSKIIPDIKEVVISGTMMGDNSGPSGKIEKGKPQLAMFSADTEPNLDVARAVHASAALPGAFKPVDIKLSSGVTARFEDGGVMNNAPTRATVGADREVDPMTDTGNMTFVFEEEASHEILAGTATPSKSRLLNFIAGANVGAADYAKNRTLADKPEDVVMVPLKVPGPWYKHTDFSGMMGTLDFKMANGPKQKLQGMTKDATLANIKKRQEPTTKTFGSVGEMLNSASEADLAAMADSDFPGAKDEMAFRKSVKDGVAKLEGLASHGAKAESLQAGPIKTELAALAALAGDDKSRQALIGREVNRSGSLDPLLKVAKETGNAGFKILEAGVAVSDALEAHNHAQTILREMIYPKMMDESPSGAGGTVLRQVDDILRSAKSKDDVNRALTIAINHFAAKSDPLNYHGHHAFAAKLKTYVMK